MKTYIQTREEAFKSRQWLTVDASGLPLGRLASEVAKLLRGKHKPKFTPHVDGGDFVIITNAKLVKLTGKKGSDKVYRWHTGFIGGLKEFTADDLLARHPELLIERAVKRMLPAGPLGRDMFRKLKVYPGPEHPHSSQRPQVYTLKGREAK